MVSTDKIAYLLNARSKVWCNIYIRLKLLLFSLLDLDRRVDTQDIQLDCARKLRDQALSCPSTRCGHDLIVIWMLSSASVSLVTHGALYWHRSHKLGGAVAPKERSGLPNNSLFFHARVRQSSNSIK